MVEDSEIKGEFERLKKLSEKFRKELEAVFDQSPIGPSQLEEILHNPKYFTSQQWSFIERERAKWDKKLLEQIGKKEGNKFLNSRKKKGRPKGFKKLRRKRRGWLDMG
jgi:hypothetical protein